MNFKSTALGLSMLVLSTSTNAVYSTFTDDGDFLVPNGVNSVNVLVVGGGGGGANGHQGGGGAGFVTTGTFAVNAGEIVSIAIGAGGAGGAESYESNIIIGLTAGTTSFFGSYLSSAGGGIVSGINKGGHDGSSGGGAACNPGSLGGAGGAGGGDGQVCQSGPPAAVPIGFGQGDYISLLAIFIDNIIGPGAGGAGGTGSHAGGGGAGGILINGFGLSALDGNQSWSGKGGVGYGAGGGAGGLDQAISGTRFGGGDGAKGLVYIEYASAVPAPTAVWLIGSGLISLIAVARRKA